MQREAHVRGVLGEVRAEQFLVGKGYAILDRNVKAPGAEIDLVAMDGSVIVFVEVKARTRSAVSGREAVTAAKQKRICRGALHYLMKHGLMNRQVRFDVMEIQDGRVTHIVNAFAYQGPAF